MTGRGQATALRVDHDQVASNLHSRFAAHDGLSGRRVVFVNRYYYPDVSATSQILYDLTRRLARHGMVVHVVCSQQLYEDPGVKLPADEVVEGVHVHRVRTTRFGRSRLLGRAFDYATFYITAWYKLLQITERGDVLVAKTDPPLISVVAAVVAKWRKAVLVNWLQDLFPEVAMHLSDRKLPRWMERVLTGLRDRSLRAATANIVIGTRMKELLLKRRIDASSIHVIENWSDDTFVSPKLVTDSQLRSSLGLQDKFIVGYSGNLGRAHDYETLLQAAMILRNDKDVVFLMIGGGNKMQQLKAAVKSASLNNFLFLPYQPREQLSDSLAAADVHLISLLPSLEGLIVPSKFYGILAAGRPAIVIGDVDGELARIAKQDHCGLSVAVGDAEGLVTALLSLKDNAALRQSMGRRACDLFIENYTADCGAEKWLNVLATLTIHQSIKPPDILASA